MTEDKIIRGVLHSHSDISHDGTLTLEELRAFFMSKGFRFLCLTDHSQDLSPEHYQRLKAQCRELSDDRFVFIPGIEYSCEGEVHIMGIGVESMTHETEHKKVIEDIHANGGMAIWAHPSEKNYPVDNSWISKLDGVEIWNLRGDGKFLPKAKTIDAYYKYKKVNPSILAYFGMDFHNIETYYNLSVKLNNTVCDEKHILEALKSGNFISTSSTISMTPEPVLGGLKRMIMAVIKAGLDLLKSLKNRIKGAKR